MFFADVMGLMASPNRCQFNFCAFVLLCFCLQWNFVYLDFLIVSRFNVADLRSE